MKVIAFIILYFAVGTVYSAFLKADADKTGLPVHGPVFAVVVILWPIILIAAFWVTVWQKLVKAFNGR